MSLVSYTPFQQSIIHAVKSFEETSKLLQQDMIAFQKEKGEIYGNSEEMYMATWKTGLDDNLKIVFSDRIGLAMRFTCFTHATAEQEKEVLRFINPMPKWKEFSDLPRKALQIIDEYSELSMIQKIGDITRSMFDALDRYPDLKKYGETPEEIVKHSHRRTGKQFAVGGSPDHVKKCVS